MPRHVFWDTPNSNVGKKGFHHSDALRRGLEEQVHPVKIHCIRGKLVEYSASEFLDVQVGKFKYADGTLAAIEAETSYSPVFGAVRVGGFSVAVQGYIGSVDGWTAIPGSVHAPRPSGFGKESLLPDERPQLSAQVVSSAPRDPEP